LIISTHSLQKSRIAAIDDRMPRSSCSSIVSAQCADRFGLNGANVADEQRNSKNRIVTVLQLTERGAVRYFIGGDIK
jgi:hypothetical protein